MLNGIRVLVVEDEPFFAQELAEAITRGEGEVVGPFASIGAARAAVRSTDVDVAILDVNLSDGQITPVLEALSARKVPIVVCTGSDVPADVLHRHPDLRVIAKPVQTARVLAELRRATRQKA